jgi:S-ribosylhomocysteine lyase
MADLDSRTVAAPYLRLAEKYDTPNGDVVALWDLRIQQPNTSRVPPEVIHSIEHSLIYAMRRVVDPRAFLAAPMGCSTGFYISAINITDYDEMESVIAAALTWLGEQDAIPWADVEHCGMYLSHSLDGAKELAARLLSQRAEWADPGPNAREFTDDITADSPE